MEKDYSYLKQLCSESGTFRKLDDDLSVDFEKLKLEAEKEAEKTQEDGTLF